MLSVSFMTSLKVIPVSLASMLGVFLMLMMLNQLYSGLMCALYTVNESLLLVLASDEVDMEELYSDDLFNLHESGVDLTFIFLYLHLYSKLYLKSYYLLQVSAWKSGSLLFLLMHGVIFFGLVLCCTHLSDITLKMAANILQTVFFKYGSVSYLLFTTHTMNTDTLISMMYLHYILAMGMWGVIVLHLLDMHYGYSNNIFFKFLNQLLNWFGEVFKFEYLSMMFVLSLLVWATSLYFTSNEPLSYEIFMWGDMGMNTEVSFLSVAPHWYFSSYMSWLLFCPHHYLGIYGLMVLFVMVYFLPNLYNWIMKSYKHLQKMVNLSKSYLSSVMYWIFMLCGLYSISYLPCGKYFTYVQGNMATTFSYLYIYAYYFMLLDMFFKKYMFKSFNLNVTV